MAGLALVNIGMVAAKTKLLGRPYRGPLRMHAVTVATQNALVVLDLRKIMRIDLVSLAVGKRATEYGITIRVDEDIVVAQDVAARTYLLRHLGAFKAIEPIELVHLPLSYILMDLPKALVIIVTRDAIQSRMHTPLGNLAPVVLKRRSLRTMAARAIGAHRPVVIHGFIARGLGPQRLCLAESETRRSTQSASHKDSSQDAHRSQAHAMGYG